MYYINTHQISCFSVMTALWVDMIVSFCLPHTVVVSAFIICKGVCVCVLRYCECVCCM